MLNEGERFALHHGDCIELMNSWRADGLRVDHVITDPPYSTQVHRSVRSSRRNKLPDAAESECRTRRSVDLGFDPISEPEIMGASVLFCALARRWAMAFSDVESAHLWRKSMEAAGLIYKRTGAWIRINGAPQFTGDRPAAGFEAITMAHAKGRSRWNGGGHQAVYEHCVVANRSGHRGTRLYTTQKPLPLMMELVELFTDVGDVVLDPYCGSGTTGVACLRLGRRFVGIEKNATTAAIAIERIKADTRGLSVRQARQGQEPLPFGIAQA